MAVELSRLIEKLNPICVEALRQGVSRCVAKSHHSVEPEHWLVQILEQDDSDLRRILRDAGIDPDAARAAWNRGIDRFKTGNARTPTIAAGIETILREAWLLASVGLGERAIRSGTVLLAALADRSVGRGLRDGFPEIDRVKPEAVQARFAEIVGGSPEDVSVVESFSGPKGAPASSGSGARPVSAETPALDQFTVDLTAQARAGAIDPVLGRDAEIRLMIDILTRRRQNNPILTGEAGVGKTAVVEGFALRVATGDVPPSLKDVAVRVLDLGLLQAGAGVRGEFENRLKGVIAEVKASPTSIILFIDEAHTIIGAGGEAGKGDAANLLKPALARGELRTIAATTWAEYKKYFEKDAALSRRFQVVKVEEPSEAIATEMMRGLIPVLEDHHGVRILEEAASAAVKLSARYITGRQLPDKAVSLLDTTCAKVAISRSAVPAGVEDARRRIDGLSAEIDHLRREGLTHAPQAERIDALETDRRAERDRLAELERRWEAELALVEKVHDLTARIEAAHAAVEATGTGAATGASSADDEALKDELAARRAELRSLQGNSPLTLAYVDAQAVAEVVSGWTGIPVGRMQADEIQTILTLQDRLAARVVGQDDALEILCRRIRTSRAQLTDPRKPIGVFLLVGPSGVGKTETALALAEDLYGGERNLIVINMSEYQERHTISSLKGSPPGYVGYGEGGVLTEAVRRKPYSVVLLDEVEKAHPDVHELFFQVFDKGTLEDGEGREIDFKNTVILLTSNVGSETIVDVCPEGKPRPSHEAIAAALRDDLLGVFPPAFLGRLIVVPYYPIRDDVLKSIIRLQLDRIGARLAAEHRAAFTYDESLVDRVAARCTEVASGARNVDHILTRSLLPAISTGLLTRLVEGTPPRSVHAYVDDSGEFAYRMD